MPRHDFDYTVKFFHPPQRSVAYKDALLDIKTKRIIAQDRTVIEQERTVALERRRSYVNIQLLNHEQKQTEKKLASIANASPSLKDEFIHRKSISHCARSKEVSTRKPNDSRRSSSWNTTNERSELKQSVIYKSLSSSNTMSNLSIPLENEQSHNSNYLSVDRRYSGTSESDACEQTDSDDNDGEINYSDDNNKVGIVDYTKIDLFRELTRKKRTKKKKPLPLGTIIPDITIIPVDEAVINEDE
ncbi:unnamed protein product [Didymodactylos carnosus]|uniref:Uncharacterized protein n=1 Tax=Didymodactylos carnosus TaxID=1234261 RepID=A0A814CGA5_9BILA|nr:unnamed protein product [Didymodactylos carnosus]CAF0996573.1 unnamed protein product [Didymodactylos carnosus]CAF3720314.1 unnamed protein product [Didymodactylos carnosus]CAF3766324.1 unnamed protein product [Didymodactylos carnosus]